MNVHIRIPYSLEKNIGKKYNEEFVTCPDGDALAFMDGDMMFLNKDFGHILNWYANSYPNDVLTCCTNRTHSLSKGQQSWVKTTDVLELLKYADKLKEDRSVIPIHGPVSMLLTVIPKHIWQRFPFTEVNTYRPNETNMLGVDNDFTNRIRAAGIRVLRMNGLIMYHQYRLLTNSKEHLL